MTTNHHHHETAKIYQFPIGGRAALHGRRYFEKPVEDVMALRVAAMPVIGGSWYHEEAIVEAEQTRKR